MKRSVNTDGWNIDLIVIDRVESYDSGGCAIHIREGSNASVWGTTFGLTSEELKGKPPIRPGDVATLYTSGASTIRGLTVNGTTYRYKTKAQAEQERLEWVAKLDRERRERYEANIDQWQATVASLRKPLADRIRRFEAEHGAKDFWIEDGGYELFVCEQANALLDWAEYLQSLPSKDGEDHSLEAIIDRWSKMSYAEQVKTPGYIDEHSGNTHGGMIYLAKRVAQGLDV